MVKIVGFKLWTFGSKVIELLKGAPEGPLIWAPEGEHAFCHLKMALMSAPTLGLPALTKPFELYGQEWQHLMPGVVAQKVGHFRRPVGCFSEQLD